jgi:predicted dehydrogenase
MSVRIGLAGIDSSHAEDFLRHFNTEGRHPGMRIAALWGDDPQRVAELLARDGDIVAAPSLEALVRSVDAVIVGDRHGDLHLGHALPAIAAGLPVFVDKPLSNGLVDAEAMVTAAEAAGVPLCSGSALRWQAETARLKARIAGLDGSFTLATYGTWYPQNEYGGAIFYAIHSIELVQELLGIDSRKLAVAGGDVPVVTYQCGDAKVTIELRPLDASGSSAFGVRVRAKAAELDQPIVLGDDYMAPVAAKIAAMLRTGRSPLSRAELLAPVALMEEIEARLTIRA